MHNTKVNLKKYKKKSSSHLIMTRSDKQELQVGKIEYIYLNYETESRCLQLFNWYLIAAMLGLKRFLHRKWNIDDETQVSIYIFHF